TISIVKKDNVKDINFLESHGHGTRVYITETSRMGFYSNCIRW
ncbi:unnamed protein product, partial [marine sediment metagenome]